MEPFICQGSFRECAGNKIERMVRHVPFVRYVELNMVNGSYLEKIKPLRALVNDVSSECVNALRVIKNNPTALISRLLEYPLHENPFEEQEYIDPVKSAARFIYLHPKINRLEDLEVDVPRLVNFSLYLNGAEVDIVRVNRASLLEMLDKRDLVVISEDCVDWELVEWLDKKKIYFVYLHSDQLVASRFYQKTECDVNFTWNFR